MGAKDPAQAAGNHIVIRRADGRFVFLAHMQRGSVSVKIGEGRGQRVGLCGNSGNSDLPHAHLHIQDTPELNAGRGIDPILGPINIELTGRQFTQVVWPLIRGLFVSNP